MAIKCPFCKDPKILPTDKKNVAKHLIVTKDKEDHFHVHGPIKDKVLIQDFVIYILQEAGIAYSIEAEAGDKAEKSSEDNKEQG